MAFKAYGYNLSPKDYELIHRMVKLITNEVADIYDVHSYEPEVHADDVVLIYGRKAAQACKNRACRATMEFPDASRLDPALNDEEAREEAFSRLKKLEKLLDFGHTPDLDLDTQTIDETVITKEQLPDLTSSQVQKLEAIIRQKGYTEWLGTTQDGRTIRLTLQPEDSEADIDMTFAELFLLRTAMERLQVKELELVYKTSTISRKNNT